MAAIETKECELAGREKAVFCVTVVLPRKAEPDRAKPVQPRTSKGILIRNIETGRQNDHKRRIENAISGTEILRAQVKVPRATKCLLEKVLLSRGGKVFATSLR